MRKLFLALVVVMLTSLSVAGVVYAHSSEAEVDDAGDLTTTAQLTHGSDPLTMITGSITPSDADVYAVCLTGGGTFSAKTYDPVLTTFDTQLFLFDENGMGVYGNDDNGDPGLASELPAGHALTPSSPGLYYLAVARFNQEPANTDGTIFEPTAFPFDAITTPTGPGGASPLSSWENLHNTTGTYAITLTGATGSQPCTDSDGDGVSNDDDACPDVFGSLANGCPNKEEILSSSGVEGAGISDAHGLQKGFNPKSKAAANAGKK
jgi:hypothetical protein